MIMPALSTEGKPLVENPFVCIHLCMASIASSLLILVIFHAAKKIKMNCDYEKEINK